MSNKVFAGLVLITEIAVCSLVMLCLFMNIAEDLSKKVTILEEENRELRLELNVCSEVK